MKPAPIKAETIVQRQIEWTNRWHEGSTAPRHDEPWTDIERNHRMNFDLWHAEDEARRDDLGPANVCAAKRIIDRCNQSRNDAIEQFDLWLLGKLPPIRENAALHSETAGMIVDRLSIMALKIYHMRIEATRESADEAHRRKCAQKCVVLEEQHHDLKRCLQSLVDEMLAGTRQCKLYRQFKMYNDASLNPQLYQKPAAAGR
ncbi:MAG: DUF4254 domain-containing protein [Verrucomicrobiota bacterium]